MKNRTPSNGPYPTLLALIAVSVGLMGWTRPVVAQALVDFYPVTAQPGQNLIANHLDNGGNTLNEVLPVVPEGSQVWKWDEMSGTFHIDTYLDPLVGWVDDMGLPSTTTLGPREAAFFVNPLPAEVNLVLTGTARTPAPPPPLSRATLHYVSRLTKGTATYCDLAGELPTEGTLFLRYNALLQDYQTNHFTGGAWQSGEPIAEIGEGVALFPGPVAPPLPNVPAPITVFGCDPETPVHYRASYGTNRWIICFPPSGTLFTPGTHTVTCTATNECGYPVSNSFTVTIRTPVDSFPWPSPLPGIGIPFEMVGGAVAVYPPAGASSTTGPSLEVIPDNLNPNSGLHLQPGPAQALSFVAVLDFTAPMGAGFDLVLPPNSMNTNDTPILSFRNKGTKGYCVKLNKRFADDSTGTFRAAAVNTNGHLLDTLEFTSDEMRTNDVMVIGFQPGVTAVHMAVEVDCLAGGITVEFNGPVVPAAGGRKGWDGCIYGPDRPVKKPAARLVVTPPMTPGTPPITDLFLYASGVAELVLEEPAVTAKERKWSDGHVTLMKAYDDGSEQGMRFTPLAPGGVTVDLGYTASFDMRLHHFETGDMPTEEQLLTRTIGPIRGLTNRPPPPFLDAMLLKTNAATGGVDCSADFSNLGSPTVLLQIFLGGMLVAERAGVPATLDTPLFNMSDWPNRLGKLGGATPCRRGKPPVLSSFVLPPGGGLPPQVVVGDEFRVLAELPPDAPHPDFYSGFELIASAGSTWAATELETTSALTAATVSITIEPDGIRIGEAPEGFRFLGAEQVEGPYYDLGELPPRHPASSKTRFFELRESPTRRSTGQTTF